MIGITDDAHLENKVLHVIPHPIGFIAAVQPAGKCEFDFFSIAVKVGLSYESTLVVKKSVLFADSAGTVAENETSLEAKCLRINMDLPGARSKCT